MGVKDGLAELDSGMVSARRLLALLAEVYTADPDDLQVGWIQDAHIALDDLFEALGAGEDAILDRRIDRAKKERSAARSKGRRPRAPVAVANPDLSRDPKTIAGAIRCALVDAPDGLLVGDLVEAVNKLRGGETDQPSVSSALSAMVKRREIAREGFHRHYRYKLIVAPPTESDQPTEDSV